LSLWTRRRIDPEPSACRLRIGLEPVRVSPLDPRQIFIESPVEIPYGQLSPEALQGVIEAFVLREGTDYGERDYSLAEKVEHVMRQLERGEARIFFDPDSESVDIRVPSDK
jgi:uncharacterized protein YheU (UPF0270 family)